MFGSGEKCPPISATKSLTGHSLGATGVQEAIYSLLMMNNGFICESAQYRGARPGVRRHEHRAQAHRQRPARHGPVELASASAAPTRPSFCSVLVGLSGPAGPQRSTTCGPRRAGQQPKHEGGSRDGSDARQARPHHGRRQRSFDRLGHRQGAGRAGRGARLHLSGRGARQAGARRWPQSPRLGARRCPATSRTSPRVDAAFATLDKSWDAPRFRRPRHRLFRQAQLKGRYADHHAGEFLPHDGDLLLLLHRDRASARRSA